MTQLLVGTKKGLFVLEGEAGSPFEVSSRAFAGEPVEFATRDARTGRHFACVTSAFYGPKVFYADDLTAEWEQAAGIELPEGAEKPLERLWTVVPAEERRSPVRGRRSRRALREPRRWRNLGVEPGVLGAADAPRLEPRRGRHVHALDRDLARRPVAGRAGDLGGGRVADGRRRPDLAARERESLPALHARGGAHGHDRPLRPQHAPRAKAARTPLHAVPRRGLSLGRCGRKLDVHRRRSSLRLRLPDGDRPRRPRQRVRHPTRRGHGSHDAGG